MEKLKDVVHNPISTVIDSVSLDTISECTDKDDAVISDITS